MSEPWLRPPLPSDAPLIRRHCPEVFREPRKADIVVAGEGDEPLGFVVLWSQRSRGSARAAFSVHSANSAATEPNAQLRRFLQRVAVARAFETGQVNVSTTHPVQDDHPEFSELAELGFRTTATLTTLRLPLNTLLARIRPLRERMQFRSAAPLTTVPLAEKTASAVASFLRSARLPGLQVGDWPQSTALVHGASIEGLIAAREDEDVDGLPRTRVHVLALRPRWRFTGGPLLLDAWANSLAAPNESVLEFELNLDAIPALTALLRHLNAEETGEKRHLLARWLPPLELLRSEPMT